MIDSEGKQLGIFSIKEALKMAEDMNLDLVEVAPQAEPPVCKLMDYGKYKYQISKKIQEARKKQTVIEVKEVKLRPSTEDHDLQFKINHIKRFLSQGNKAKVSVIFRGREIVHTEIGRNLLERVYQEVKDIGIIEQMPKMEGKTLTMIITPKT